MQTGKYLAIMDEHNNEMLGISDMEINDSLTFKNVYEFYLKDYADNLTKKDIVIVDANFHKDSLRELL